MIVHSYLSQFILLPFFAPLLSPIYVNPCPTFHTIVIADPLKVLGALTRSCEFYEDPMIVSQQLYSHIQVKVMRESLLEKEKRLITSLSPPPPSTHTQTIITNNHYNYNHKPIDAQDSKDLFTFIFIIHVHCSFTGDKGLEICFPPPLQGKWMINMHSRKYTSLVHKSQYWCY